jgi:hypothetical protein
MNLKEKIIYKLFQQIYNLAAKKAKKGHGSSLTIEFGNELEYEIKLRGKLEKKKRREWQFWIYMSAWRIDENLIPIAGCEDSIEIIEKALKKIENKKLISVKVLNPAFDMKIEFENSIIINLFTIYTNESDSENWMLFTPERKVLTAGPGGQLIYESSGE